VGRDTLTREDRTMAGKRPSGANGHAADEAFEEARGATEGGMPGLLSSLAEKVGATARASAVFGEPVEREGRTVIPVAQAMWGSGAGSGSSDDEGSGSGAGGGAMTKPVGYIELSGQGASFVPLQRPWQDAKLVLAWAFAVWLVARAARLLLRR
jgi:uncharacterized spore protein YtfJ